MAKPKLGFSLIELLIVLIIISVLTAIAVPSYRSYLFHARRSSAQIALMGLAAQTENYYLKHNTYLGADTSLGLPSETEDHNYALSLSNLSANSYTLNATAQNAQSGDSDCPSLSLDQLGNKQPAACWK